MKFFKAIFFAVPAVALLVASYLVGVDWMNELTGREQASLVLFGVGFGVVGAVLMIVLDERPF